MPHSHDDIKVFPAGGKFKMHYTIGTRRCDELLEKALEDLNGDLAFGPDIKLQQTDIRLLALNRRTYETLAEIHNLHRVEAEDIERFVFRFLERRAPGQTAFAPAVPSAHGRASVRGFKVRRTRDSLAFNLIFLLSDGNEDDRHYLNHGTIGNLRDAGVFDPQFDIRMSPTNDRLMAYRKDAPDKKPLDEVSLVLDGSGADADAVAQRAAGFLNKYVRQCAAPVTPGSVPAPPPPAPPRPTAPPIETAPVAAASVIPSPAPVPVAGPPPVAPAVPPPRKTDPNHELFKRASVLSPESRNVAAFESLALCLGVNMGIESVRVSEGHALLSLNGQARLGSQFTGFVLTSKHNLAFCRNELTVRFGCDHTFLENDKTGDTWKHPGAAFAGLGLAWEGQPARAGTVAMIVSAEFLGSVPPNFRGPLKVSGIVLRTIEEWSSLSGATELIWPSSREDAVFYKTARGIRQTFRDADGRELFPVTNSTIDMSPGQAMFIGFKRTPHHGVIYEAGDDFFARFDPEETEISAADYCFAGSAGLVGFALDGSMEMCAIYDPAQAAPGFDPPGNKLIRFVAQNDLGRVASEDPQFARLS